MNTGGSDVPQTLPLRDHIARMLSTYFHNVGGMMPMQGLHELIMSEVEQPLLEITLQFTQGNMAKAAKILGISRATLRKKLEHYGVIQKGK